MKGSKLKRYKRFELRMFWVLFDSVEPKVLHVLCHCYAAINIFIKIFKVIITFSYRTYDHSNSKTILSKLHTSIPLPSGGLQIKMLFKG